MAQARKPIKPLRKRRALPEPKATPPPRRRITQPTVAATSDPVEGRVSPPNDGKKYVEHTMNQYKKHRDSKARCYVYFQSYVDFGRAEEWARYWQPRLGTPIGLVIEGTLEKVNIDHGTTDDPFPKREIDYPWKVEAAEYLARNSRQWVNDGTLKTRPAVAEPEPAATPPQSTVQAVAAPARRGLPAKPPAPRSLPPKPAVAVAPITPIAPVVRRTVAKPAPAPPRRMTPTPPNRKRR